MGDQPQPAAGWRYGVGFALAVMLLTSLPYLLGVLRQNETWGYSGLLLGVEDGFSYLGKMRLGTEGAWRFSLFYTDEPHPPAALTFLPYIAPAHLLRGVPPELRYDALVGMFHVMRVGFGVLMILATLWFIRQYVETPAAQRLALLLATVGGGLGVLLLLINQIPPDWYIPEAFSFLRLLTFPHLGLARAALLGGMVCLIRAYTHGGRWLWAAIALWLLMAVGVPFYLALVYAIVGFWGVLLWIRTRRFPLRLFWQGLTIGITTAPLLTFYFVTYRTNPVFALWDAQSVIVSPPLLHTLIGYSPVLLLSIWGVPRAWQAARPHDLLLLAWALVGLTFVYLPLNLQRRLSEGVFVVLVILAVWGLQALWERWQSVRLQRALKGGLVTLSLCSSAMLYSGTLNAVQTLGTPLYIHTDERAALIWLAQNAAPNSILLAPRTVSNHAPSFAPVRTYSGHGPETLYTTEKASTTQAYFAGELSPETRRALYQERPIDYVIFDAMPPAWAPTELTLRYQQGDFSVWQVAPR